jgi:hypothetical protein
MLTPTLLVLQSVSSVVGGKRQQFDRVTRWGEKWVIVYFGYFLNYNSKPKFRATFSMVEVMY